MGPFLSLTDATFRLGDRLVFPNTTWKFGVDEHWAILGPNGSGKSLFGDALRGQLPLVHGELEYHFRAPAGLSPEEAIGHVAFEDRRKEVHGTVTQSRWNSLEEAESLRVAEFLSYDRVMEVNPFEVSQSHGVARRAFARRRRRVISLLRLEPLRDRALIALSNGERQRLELARQLCRPLRMLILDEPFAGLDTAMRSHLQNVLERIMATRLRVLLITNRAEDLPRSVTHTLQVEACNVVGARKRGKISVARSPLAKPSNRRPRDHRTRSTAGESSELIRLNNVTVRYGNKTILQAVNWRVRAGENWAVLGPNGSGKSTLLSLLLGDNPQVYANDVIVLGRRPGNGESIWELKREIGWVSPELHVHFDDQLTCLEAVGSAFHGTIGLFEPLTRPQRAAALHWLKTFDLEEFSVTPLFALSVGQQRLALLARAVVKRPRLLVLDEPCQGLDARHRQMFVATVDRLIRTGTVTTIYVTHRKEELPMGISRVLRLKEGRASVA